VAEYAIWSRTSAGVSEGGRSRENTISIGGTSMRVLSIVILAMLTVGCASDPTTSRPEPEQAVLIPPEVSAPSPIIQSADRLIADCLNLEAEGRFDEAITACLKALKANPENQEVTRALGHALSTH
jgi:Flp pilus assembly protein TadD